MPPPPEPIFGEIKPPIKTITPASPYGSLAEGGLILLFSNLIKLVVVVAGIYSFFNILIAGINYITSGGDPKGTQAARDKIKASLIGLAIMVGAFAITAVISQFLFGRYDAILSPQIYGPGAN